MIYHNLFGEGSEYGIQKTISCNPSMAGIAEVFSDITYAVEDGVEGVFGEC